MSTLKRAVVALIIGTSMTMLSRSSGRLGQGRVRTQFDQALYRARARRLRRRQQLGEGHTAA